MASLQTAIELTDHFSVPIYNMINSMNLAISSVYDMQQAMNSDINTTCIDTAREELNQATIALDEFNRAMQDMAGAGITAPVVPDIAEPIQIPVQWQTDSMEVFSSSGMERFVQEAQSVNTAMEQLSMTQNEIARQAFNTNILPPQAAQDMNAMAVRIDNIRNRIIQIENNPMSLDTGMANNELEQLRMQLNQAITQQNTLNSAIERMDVGAANTAYRQLSGTIGNTERYIRDNINEQAAFNSSIQQGTDNADNLMNKIKGAVGAYLTIQSIGGIFNVSDEIILTQSRLNLMNDSLQSTEDLMNMTYLAAQNARGAFTDMARVVARIGNNAKGAFGSSAEVVQFAELVQKQMTLAGATTQESSAAMLQLTQALGSGVLRGEELNSVFEQAPNLIQNIADYLNVQSGQIRAMASEGELSADIVKAAVFAASDEINESFDQMPMTWGQIWQSMQNTAIMAFLPVLQRINDMGNSEGFQVFVNNVINGMATVANVTLDIFDVMGAAAGFVCDNWSVISPLIYGVVAAMLFYIAVLGIYNIAQAISSGIQAGAAFIENVHAASIMRATGATFAQTAAQYGFNAALLACPVTWIVIAIIAVIAILVAFCAHIAKTGETATTTFGVICGVLNVVKTAFFNLAIDAVNGFLGIGMAVDAVGYNIMAAFTNSFNRSQSVVYTFAAVALTAIAQVAEALNNLPFVEFDTSGLTTAANDYAGKAAEAYGNQKDYKNVADAYMEGATTFERQDYGKAYADGAKWGDNVTAKFKDLTDGINIPDPNDYKNMLDSSNVAANTANAANNTNKTAGNSSKIAKQLEITSEDLKYLRDMAEQDVINRFTTAEIKVDVTNHNTINNDMDLDGVTEHLRMTIEDQMAAAAEGVY